MEMIYSIVGIVALIAISYAMAVYQMKRDKD